jgi:hypothetical protein
MWLGIIDWIVEKKNMRPEIKMYALTSGMKRIFEVEEKPFTSALNICQEA